MLVRRPRLGQASILLLMGSLTLAAAGCDGPNPNFVTPDPNDSSPPTIALDVYNLPLQQGASSQPNPESVDANCCDITRTADRVELTLVAGITDNESGGRQVGIWVDMTTTCTTPGGLARQIGPGLLGKPNAEYRDTRTNPTSVAKNVFTSMTFSRATFSRCAAGETFAGKATVWAEGENFAGKKARTKSFTLAFD
jgi:hypothetical protein